MSEEKSDLLSNEDKSKQSENRTVVSRLSQNKLLFTTVIFVAITFFTLFITGIITAKTQFSWMNEEDERVGVSFPLHGEHIIIKSVESYWTPTMVSEDGEKITKFIPTTIIELDKKSTDSAIRCFITDGRGRHIGDPLTSEFKNGGFDGSSTLTFQCSDGMNGKGEFNAYTTGIKKDWHLEISEAVGKSSAQPDFKPLEKIKILPTIRKN